MANNYTYITTTITGQPIPTVPFTSEHKYSYFEPHTAYSLQEMSFLEQLKIYGQIPNFDVENLFVYAPLEDQTRGRWFIEDGVKVKRYVWEIEYWQNRGFVSKNIKTPIWEPKQNLLSLNGYGSTCKLLLWNNKFYGLSPFGGENSGGVLFEWDPISNTYHVKVNFDSTETGRTPYGSLTLANNIFYGFTSAGEANDGSIFKWDPITEELTILSDFSTDPNVYAGGPGDAPLIIGDILYGISPDHGGGDEGYLFKFNLITGEFTTLHEFGVESGDSWYPYCGLTVSGNKLYGVASQGGTGDGGNLFSWNLLTSEYTVEYNFSSIGIHPYGTLVKVGNLLCGTCSEGGEYDLGCLFSWNTETSTMIKIIDFDVAIGGLPYSGLTLYNGKIYGSTTTDSTQGFGSIFEYDPATNKFQVKFGIEVEKTQGGWYPGPLTPFNDKLYGITQFGDDYNNSTLFSFDPVNREQVGFIPSLFSKNALATEELKMATDRLTVPKYLPIFISIKEVAGATKVIWKLTNITRADSPEDVIEVEAGWTFIWRFQESGDYQVSAKVIDLWGNEHILPEIKFIKVLLKEDYIEYIEDQLNRRTPQASPAPTVINVNGKLLNTASDTYVLLNDGTIIDPDTGKQVN